MILFQGSQDPYHNVGQAHGMPQLILFIIFNPLK
jgi:uracil DNA glycosylase